MDSRKVVHLVDYLNTSLGNTDQGKTVIITIRPDKDSFRPHNIALLRPQAERLLKDLQRLLTAVPLLLLLIGTGCSGRVQVTTESSIHSAASKSVKKCHTDVALGFLADQEEALQSPMTEKASTLVAVNVLTPKSPATQEEPPPQVTKLVTNIHNTVINVSEDLHFHHHIHEAPERLEPTPSPARVEVQRRPVDPRCERYRREYLERTREWRRLFPNLKEG